MERKWIFERLPRDCIDKDFSYFINDIDCITDNIINQTDTIICSFIGNYSIGKILIEKLIISDKRDLANIFIFREKEDYLKLENLLNPFSNKMVLLSKEYGNDIIPTLQALNYYDSKYEYSNLIKLQTKSKMDWFNECSDYLINNTVEYLKSQYNESKSNCVGHPKHYVSVDNDKYCRDLYNKYSEHIGKEYFVAGTMFYTNKDIIDYIIEFIHNNNYRGYFMNNMYDNNAINVSNSSIHFLERLFGIFKSKIIKLNKNRYIIFHNDIIIDELNKFKQIELKPNKLIYNEEMNYFVVNDIKYKKFIGNLLYFNKSSICDKILDYNIDFEYHSKNKKNKILIILHIGSLNFKFYLQLIKNIINENKNISLIITIIIKFILEIIKKL